MSTDISKLVDSIIAGIPTDSSQGISTLQNLLSYSEKAGVYDDVVESPEYKAYMEGIAQRFEAAKDEMRHDTSYVYIQPLMDVLPQYTDEKAKAIAARGLTSAEAMMLDKIDELEQVDVQHATKTSLITRLPKVLFGFIYEMAVRPLIEYYASREPSVSEEDWDSYIEGIKATSAVEGSNSAEYEIGSKLKQDPFLKALFHVEKVIVDNEKSTVEQKVVGAPVEMYSKYPSASILAEAVDSMTQPGIRRSDRYTLDELLNLTMTVSSALFHPKAVGEKAPWGGKKLPLATEKLDYNASTPENMLEAIVTAVWNINSIIERSDTEDNKFLLDEIETLEKAVASLNSKLESISKEEQPITREVSMPEGKKAESSIKTYRVGMPVRIANHNEDYVIIDVDEADPTSVVLILENNINAHKHVSPVTAKLNDLTPVSRYASLKANDVVESDKGLLTVIDAAEGFYGYASVRLPSGEVLECVSLADLGVKADVVEPYKLFHCRYCQAPVTDTDHEAECHKMYSTVTLGAANIQRHASYMQAELDAAEQAEVNAKAFFKKAARVSTAALQNIDKILDSLTLEDFGIYQKGSLINLYDEPITMGSSVRKPGINRVGTVLANSKHCVFVEWDNGEEEQCWPQELVAVTYQK